MNPLDEQLLSYADSPSDGGSRMITNVPSMMPAADVYIEPPPQAAAPIISETPEGDKDLFTDYEQRIIGAPDFLSKQKIINELANDVQTRLSTIQSTLQERSEKQLNIQPERERLAAMMNRDRRVEGLRGRDSEETITQRAKVLKMEDLARKTTDEILRRDPQVAAFTNNAKNIVTTFSKMAEKSYQDAEKLLQKQEAEKEAAAQIIGMADPQAREAIARINPAMADDVTFAKFITQGGGRSKDWAPIINGTITPDKYLEASIEGNGAARQLAISEYSARAGKSLDEARSVVGYAETLGRNPNLAIEQAAKLGIIDPKAGQDLLAKYNIAPTAEKKALNKQIIDMIPDIMEKRTVGYVQTNPIAVATNIKDPAFTEIGTKVAARTPGKSPTTYDISLAYINDPTITPTQKIERQDKVTKAYVEALAKEGSNGILHTPFDKGRLSDEGRKFKTALTARTVSETVAAKVGEFLSRANAYSGVGSPINVGKNIGRELGGALMDFGDDLVAGYNRSAQ